MAALGRKKCPKCGVNRQLKFWVPNARICNVCKKITRRKNGRAGHLSKTYKITPEEYDKLKDLYGGCCWLCGDRRPYNLQVDHDHLLEQMVGIRASIRGLLCKRCNKVLRDLRDNTELAKRIVHYLMTGRIRAQEILYPEKNIRIN